MEQMLTTDDLIKALHTLGVKEGMTLLVHSSISAFGCYICGAELAIIDALCASVGETGTIIMPAHSATYSEPAYWQNPPIPSEWWQIVREKMPAFTPETAPTVGIGKVPALFIQMPNVYRSNHPMCSFAAWGKNAIHFTENHSLAFGLGDNSPLAHIVKAKGYVLFFGAPFESNTLLHLSEFYSDFPSKVTRKQGAPILIDGKRQWVEYDEVDEDNIDFDRITREYIVQSITSKHHTVGKADLWLLPAKELVEFGTQWMNENRV